MFGKYISLVFNKKLFEECILVKDGIRIPLEVQVKKSVSLKYLDALSIPVLPFLKPFFSDNYKIDFDTNHGYLNNNYYILLEEIIKLMEKYNINVPIVDIITGNEYRENKDYKKIIKERVNIYDSNNSFRN